MRRAPIILILSLVALHYSASLCGQDQPVRPAITGITHRSEEHTSELQSLTNLVCRLLLEKKNAHPASQILRLADVDYRAVCVFVEIHSGQGGKFGHFFAELGSRIDTSAANDTLGMRFVLG